MAELAGYVGAHLRGRIPYRPGWGVVAINGTDRVESATVARLDEQWRPVAGTERTVQCDAVCLGHGFTPRLELAIAAGCGLSRDRFVTVDDGQRTSVPSVFAAGEITGIGGVDLALAEGEIAGWVAAGGALTDSQLAARGARPCGVHAIRAPDRRRAPHRVGVDRLARTVDRGLPLRRGRLRHPAGGPP